MFIKHLPYKRLTEGKDCDLGSWCLLRKNRCFHAFMPSALPFWLEIFLIFPKKKVSFRPTSKTTTYVKPLLREAKKKKKKSLTVEEVFFPADCKCIFLCCFLNDLGNYRNHETINTYILFFLTPLLYTIQTF